MQDIDRRLQTYGYKNLRKKTANVEKIYEEKDELILTSHHVSCLAYILGYHDYENIGKYQGSEYLEDSSGICFSTFRTEIKPLIPNKSITESDPPRYKLSGVKIAMKKLHKDCELDYSKERFEIALKALQKLY